MEPLSWRVDGSITYQTIGDGGVNPFYTFPLRKSISKDVVFVTATDVLDLYGFDKKPELGKICRYIQRTDKGRLSKDMYSDDLRALYLLGLESVCESIILSFYFGQAKGFRVCNEIRRKEKYE